MVAINQTGLVYALARTANNPAISQDERTRAVLFGGLLSGSILTSVVLTELTVQDAEKTPDGALPTTPTKVHIFNLEKRFLEDPLIKSTITSAEGQGVKFEFKDASGNDVPRTFGRITK